MVSLGDQSNQLLGWTNLHTGQVGYVWSEEVISIQMTRTCRSFEFTNVIGQGGCGMHLKVKMLNRKLHVGKL